MSDIQRSEKSVKALRVASDRSLPSSGRELRKFAIWGLGVLITAAMTVWIGLICWGLLSIFQRLLHFFD
jgi:hypothetical protein